VPAGRFPLLTGGRRAVRLVARETGSAGSAPKACPCATVPREPDEVTRECLAIEGAYSISAESVVELLKWLALTRGTPQHIRSDNGSELIAQAVQGWLERVGCETIYITPDSPCKNPYIESFTGKFKDECLNRELFMDLQEARLAIEAWREEYNTERPHSSLGYLTPAEFTQQWREGEVEAARCVGSGRATPSLRPHSATEAVTLSLQLVRRAAGGQRLDCRNSTPTISTFAQEPDSSSNNSGTWGLLLSWEKGSM